MAHDTNETIFDLSIYEIFPRIYAEERNAFRRISEFLPLLKDLGVNAVWLMPIHPVGELHRKGSYGSPYAIQDFFEIDDFLGTKQEFLQMVRFAHSLGMKVFMDMVMNHCACDAPIAKKHPEWLLRDHSNRFSRKVADWSDVYDLNYANHALSDYMIKVMKYWIEEFDVDGFRCDVADLVPLAFWMRARHEISLIKKGFVWLSEGHGDEMYQAFDVTYDYDGFTQFLLYLNGKFGLDQYIRYLNHQNSRLSANAAKLRFLENHDQERFARLIGDRGLLRNWTAFYIMLKGIPLVYDGQEYCSTKKLDIFGTPAPEDWKENQFRDFIKNLLRFRKRSRVMRYGQMSLQVDNKNDTVLVTRRLGKHEVIGAMNFSGKDRGITLGVETETSNYAHFLEHVSNTPYHLKVTNSKAQLLLDSQPMVLSRVSYR